MVIKLPRSRESTPVAVTPPSTTLGNTGPVCSFLFRFVPAPPGVFEPVGIPTIEPVPFRLALHARCAGFLDLDVLRSLGLFHASSRRGRSSARPSSQAVFVRVSRELIGGSGRTAGR